MSTPPNPYRPEDSATGQAGYTSPLHDAPTYDAPVYGAPQASPYTASPYGAAPYAPGGYAPVQNQMALIALICSLAGLVTGLSAIAGIVCGHIALSQLKQNPQQTGRGMAIAALWVGYGLLVLGILLVVGWFVLVFSLANSTSTY